MFSATSPIDGLAGNEFPAGPDRYPSVSPMPRQVLEKTSDDRRRVGGGRPVSKTAPSCPT
jgi:hypothetical protein